MRNIFRPHALKRKNWLLFRLLTKTVFPDLHKNVIEKHEFKLIFKIINVTRLLILGVFNNRVLRRIFGPQRD
jgi:hypothetical protein